MTESLIQFPPLSDIKEMLVIAKKDIAAEIQEDPDALESSQLLSQLITIIEGKLAKAPNLEKLSELDKIDIAAHLNFFDSLVQDFFYTDDEDFDDEEEMDEDGLFDDEFECEEEACCDHDEELEEAESRR